MIRLGIILGGLHFLLCCVVFLMFGLGLEGETTGTWILPILLQPSLFLVQAVPVLAGWDMILIVLNSLLWGMAIAGIIILVRGSDTPPLS